MIYHKIQRTIKRDSYTKANKSGEEAQKETMRLIDIGLPQSKNKVNSNSNSKARIESTYFGAICDTCFSSPKTRNCPGPLSGPVVTKTS